MPLNTWNILLSMQPPLRVALHQLAVDILGRLPLAQLLRWGASSSGKTRAYQRRLRLVAQAQAAKAARSPPKAICKLLFFTANVVTAVAVLKLKEMWFLVVRRAEQWILQSSRARSMPISSSTFA